jgi:hypothetical protein
MISKVITDWMRDLANRLEIIVDSGLAETADIRQLVDLADTLDEERKDAQFEESRAVFNRRVGE